MTTIQIRRISAKINRYLSRFGFRTHTEYQNTRAKILAAKDLGLDQIECKIAETSRGTAIGFYSKNGWTNFLVFIPFAFLLGLPLLKSNNLLPSSLSGENSFVDITSLLGGDLNLNFLSISVLVLIPLIFSLMSYAMQQIRLSFIKSRFSFFTKDANWNPSELTPTMISFRGAQTAFFHGWLFAIVYFSVFAMPSYILSDVLALYQISQETLREGVNAGFLIVSGSLVGLVSADKSNKLRKEYSRQDKTLRFGSGIVLRRVEGILYSLSSALIAGIFFLPFISLTFVNSTSASLLVFHTSGYLIAAVIGGYIRDEGAISFVTAYGSMLLFLSLGLVFRTGAEPAFAFVVILQLLLIPFSLLLIANRGVENKFAEYKVKSIDYYYQFLPLNIFVTIYLLLSRKRKRQIQYEKSLEEDTILEDDEGQLYIDRSVIEGKSGELGILIAKHYFELMAWYNSSFDENQLVLIPTQKELISYVSERTGKQPSMEDFEFLSMADRLIWDITFSPEKEELAHTEKSGKKLVLELR